MKRSGMTLLLSVLLISGIPWTFYGGYRLYLKKAQANPEAYVRTIIAIPKGDERVSVPHIAEILNLSSDIPDHLYRISLSDMEKKMAATHVFSEVEVKRIHPSSLRIEYRMRTPLYRLISQENTLIDRDGVLFPEYPFYTPKRLIEVALEEAHPRPWGSKLNEAEKELLLEITTLSDEVGNLRKIDLSKRNHTSLGKREIILEMGAAFLRLPTSNWEKRLLQAKALKDISASVIDLRIDGMALIQERF